MNTVIKDKWKQFINKVKSIQYKEIIKTGFNDLFKDPFFILTHPINGFSKFKSEGMRKRYVAITYLILMCLTQVIAFNGSGFLVNSKDPMRFNALRTISLVIIPGSH